MKKKVCFVATLDLSVKVFLVDHMHFLQETFDLSVIVNTDDSHFLEPYGIQAHVMPVAIERKISPLKDLRSLIDLFIVIRREKFDILHSIMPKSGLLSMMAGLLARVPVRVHTFTGQVWKNSTGAKRSILKFMDRLLVVCATHILVDSPSQREFLISEGVVSRTKSSVIGNGSMCGVDTQRFRFDPEARRKVREMYDIPPSDIVFLFLGRLKVDKGILDLARAFSSLCRWLPNTSLLIAGPDEEALAETITEICAKCSDRVHITGFADAPEQYMSAADALCLPSYREGFGLVITEAAAVGIPSIGSRIYGITDAIEDGVTGCLFEQGAHHELMQKMARFVEDPSLVRTMGKRARTNILEKFTKEKITSAMINFYKVLEGSL